MDLSSNNVLAAVLAVAVLVSLGGTFVSLNKLGNAGGGTITLTGNAESDLGTINLTVVSELAMALNDTNIDFGSGQPDTGAGIYNFACDSSDVIFSGAVNWSSTAAACDGTDEITVENTGTVVGNVSFFSNVNATGFICQQDDTGTCGAASQSVQRFQYNIATTFNCDFPPTTFTDINETNQLVCARLGPTEQFDLRALFVAPNDFDGTSLATLNFTIIDALTSACTSDIGCGE